MDRPRINFQAQADELGDNYFVSFSKTKRSEEHWTFYLVCSGVLFLMGWQSLRFKRDFVLHSGWSIFDGFVLIVLATVLVAMLLPRERDPNESVKTTILVHESTIFQKGRLPIMREFTNFVLSNPAWWVNNVASLLARYVETDEPDKGENEEEDDEQRRKEELALVELEEITVRVLNLVYRIIRTSAAPKVLRKMLREEANTYVHWCIGDGFIFNYIAALPEALSDLNFDPRYVWGEVVVVDGCTAGQSGRRRLWVSLCCCRGLCVVATHVALTTRATTL